MSRLAQSFLKSTTDTSGRSLLQYLKNDRHVSGVDVSMLAHALGAGPGGKHKLPNQAYKYSGEWLNSLQCYVLDRMKVERNYFDAHSWALFLNGCVRPSNDENYVVLQEILNQAKENKDLEISLKNCKIQSIALISQSLVRVYSNSTAQAQHFLPALIDATRREVQHGQIRDVAQLSLAFSRLCNLSLDGKKSDDCFGSFLKMCVEDKLVNPSHFDVDASAHLLLAFSRFSSERNLDISQIDRTDKGSGNTEVDFAGRLVDYFVQSYERSKNVKSNTSVLAVQALSTWGWPNLPNNMHHKLLDKIIVNNSLRPVQLLVVLQSIGQLDWGRYLTQSIFGVLMKCLDKACGDQSAAVDRHTMLAVSSGMVLTQCWPTIYSRDIAVGSLSKSILASISAMQRNHNTSARDRRHTFLSLQILFSLLLPNHTFPFSLSTITSMHSFASRGAAPDPWLGSSSLEAEIAMITKRIDGGCSVNVGAEVDPFSIDILAVKSKTV